MQWSFIMYYHDYLKTYSIDVVDKRVIFDIHFILSFYQNIFLSYDLPTSFLFTYFISTLVKSMMLKVFWRTRKKNFFYFLIYQSACIILEAPIKTITKKKYKKMKAITKASSQCKYSFELTFTWFLFVDALHSKLSGRRLMFKVNFTRKRNFNS